MRCPNHLGPRLGATRDHTHSPDPWKLKLASPSPLSRLTALPAGLLPQKPPSLPPPTFSFHPGASPYRTCHTCRSKGSVRTVAPPSFLPTVLLSACLPTPDKTSPWTSNTSHLLNPEGSQSPVNYLTLKAMHQVPDISTPTSFSPM